MDKSIYTGPEESNNRKWIPDIGLSLWIGIGALATFLGCFSIEWKRLVDFGGKLPDGTLSLWNRVAEELGQRDYYLIGLLHTDGEGYGISLLLLGCLLTAVALAVVRIGNRWLLLLYLLPLAVASLATSLMPGYIGLIVLLSGIFVAFLTMGEGKAGKKTMVPAIVGVILISLALGGVIHFTGPDLVMPPAKAAQIGRSIADQWQELRYGKMPLSKGRVSGEKRKIAGGTALEVTMEAPMPLYLRGFVGEDYGADRWTALNAPIQYGKRQLDRRLWAAGYTPLSSTAKADGLLNPEEKKQKVTVAVVGGSGEYGFIPYEIAQDRISGTKNVGSSHIFHPAGRPLREYSYAVGITTIDHWPDRAAKLFAAGGKKEIARFLHYESYINAFTYEKYTQLSNGHRKLIYDELGTSGNQEKGHIDYKLAIGNIRKYMDEQITYSDKGWKKPSGDGIYSFFKYKKGYDVHYATVATMMFRYYGIPARYVEGYLLTPKDVEKKTSGKAIAIPQKNAHSWTEIYIDGYGWVPVEVCSPYYGLMPEADLQKGLESASFLKPFQLPEQYRAKMQEEVPDKTKEEKGRRILQWILAGILICLLLATLAILSFKGIIRFRRWRIFTGREPKAAICAIYGYIQKQRWDPGEPERRILDKAAYSPHPMEDKERWQVIAGLAEMKRRKKQEKKRENKKNTKRGIR